MPYGNVSRQALTAAGFSAPRQASSYYPPGEQENHIHLGVPSQKDGQTAPENCVLVTFISLKREGNPNAAGRLAPNLDDNGRYDLNRVAWSPGWNNGNGWMPDWKAKLRAALGDLILP